MSIDTQTAPACFEKARVLLTGLRGGTGIPLSYVIRANIMPKFSKTDPRFGVTDSAYASIDEEMVARAPIIEHNYSDRTQAELETSGPFTTAFSSDMKKVYAVLHAMFGHNPVWQHVKKHQASQNGRKTWLTLHAYYFGGDKATVLCQQHLSKLSTLKFDGHSTKNWSFQKYTTAHITQHNHLHSLHTDYGADAINEIMKIKWFQDGITDPAFQPVRLSIMTDPDKFKTFDSVKDHYLAFSLVSTPHDNPGTTC